MIECRAQDGRIPDPPRFTRSEAMFGRFARQMIVFLRKEDGATTVEYAVMLALIIAVVIAVSNIGTTTNSTYSNPKLQVATKPLASGS
jgi:Flp pilus assembly pilin Flp